MTANTSQFLITYAYDNNGVCIDRTDWHWIEMPSDEAIEDYYCSFGAAAIKKVVVTRTVLITDKHESPQEVQMSTLSRRS